MKRKGLFLLLLMALMIIPLKSKAFTVDPAGICNVPGGQQANGTPKQICYTGVSREITFITSNETPDQKYFCLQEDKELNGATYGDTAIHTYSNEGYACAVYQLLEEQAFDVEDFANAISGVTNTLNFSVTANDLSHYTLSSVPGHSPADIYIKIQQRLWTMNTNVSCPNGYTYPTVTPKIEANLAATTLAKDSEGDEYMYSKITVTKNSQVPSYVVSLQNAPAGTLLSSNKTAAGVLSGTTLTTNEFYVLVPSTATNINITVKASYTYESSKVTNVTINEYKSGDANNQTLGKLSATIDMGEKTTSGQIKLTSNPVIDFKVCKTDSKTGAKMAGVTFHVTSADGSTTFDLTTGSDGCAVKENVKQAKYTVSEVAAPNGYVKMANTSVDCSSTIIGTTCPCDAKNTPIVLKVKKIDRENQEQGLVGAKMQILDKDGHVFDEWTSVLTDHIVNKNIPFGKYILREEEAPAGYIISTEIEFEIKADSYIIGNETKQYGDDAIVTVTMIDDVTKVSILKIDAATGTPLVGAKLRIELEDGTPVGEEWVTDGNPKVFTKMAFGTYYLVEVEAPEGYVLQEERQPFTISQTAPEQEIVIENHVVPNTAAAKSALLISFAMFDVALGIAIILYVRKKQVTE